MIRKALPFVFALSWYGNSSVRAASPYDPVDLDGPKGKETREAITSAIAGDIFDAFPELEKYDTPLKKKTFLTSGEAKVFTTRLEEKRSGLVAKTYMRTLGQIDRGYDLRKHGFEVMVEEDEDGWGREASKNTTLVKGLWLLKLPTFTISVFDTPMVGVLVKTPEPLAKAIEEKKDISVRVVLRLTGKAKQGTRKSDAGVFKESFPTAEIVEYVFVAGKSEIGRAKLK
jgi:hypothetical protein